MHVGFLVSTTGVLSPVILGDLGGLFLVHPTTDLDLALQFNLDVLIDSDDLRSAIDSGYLTVKDTIDGNVITSSDGLSQNFSNHGISAHTDVDFIPGPTGSQGLIFRTSGSVWIPEFVSSSNISNFFTDVDNRISGTNLDALSDVSIPTPVSGNVLTFNGSVWIDSVVSGAGGGGANALNDLTDVTITSPSYLDFLIFSGSQWVNTGASVGSYSEVISSWTLDAGNIYYNDVTHNLGTDEITVFIIDTITSKAVQVEEIEIIDDDTIRIFVNGNSHTLQVNVNTGSPVVGSTCTASNLGSGSNWFSSKLDSDLRFRSLVLGSSILSASSDANEVTLYFLSGNVPHDDLSGSGTNTHGQIDSHIGDNTIHLSVSDVDAQISGTNLDVLADVNAPTPSSGSVLKYDGSQWIPGDDQTGGAGGAKTSITFSGTRTGGLSNGDPLYPCGESNLASAEFVVPFSGSIVAIQGSTRETSVGSKDWGLQIEINGTPSPTANITGSVGQTHIYGTMSVSVNPGDKLRILKSAGVVDDWSAKYLQASFVVRED